MSLGLTGFRAVVECCFMQIELGMRQSLSYPDVGFVDKCNNYSRVHLHVFLRAQFLRVKSRIKIINIGPIKEIEIFLNKINVFIGPQSSGKSTIAKIVSFCQWVEKDCIRRQRVNHIDEDFVQEKLVDYHNFEAYLSFSSLFDYESPAVGIHFEDFKLSVRRKPGFRDSLISKNAYIPSERNLIGVPGIFATKMPYNYIMDFLRDWQQVRKRYSSSDRAQDVPTGDFYYYDEREETDMIRLPEGKTIPLCQTSSGMQSVTPLTVYINYVTDWIYSHKEQRSAEEEEAALEAALANMLDSVQDETKDSGILDKINHAGESSEKKIIFNHLLSRFRQMMLEPETAEDSEGLKSFLKMIDFMSRPSYSNLIIEEPEQNLFPETQRKVVEYIFANLKPERDNLLLTTHSPFVLYSINNCMLGYLANQNMGEDDEEMIDIPVESLIDPAKVSVWELRDGFIENISGGRNATIQDERGLIRGNYFDRIMGNVMADFSNMLGLL